MELNTDHITVEVVSGQPLAPEPVVTPAEPVVETASEAPAEPAQEPATEPQSDAAAETPAEPAPPPEGEPKKPKGFMTRIDELTKNWRTTERERDALAERLAKYESAQAPAQPQPGAPATDGAPDPNDTAKFPLGEFDPAYQAASIAFHVDRALRQRDAQAAAKAAEDARTAQERTFAEKTAAFRSKITDADVGAVTLLTSELPVTREMAELIMASDKDVKVADYLGRNPAEVSRIAALPPHLQGREIALIESRVAATAPVQSPPRVSAAPAPGTVLGSRAQPSNDFNPKMTQAEFTAWVNSTYGGFGRRSATT